MTTIETAFAYDFAALTDRGCRRDHNEDAIASCPEFGLWAVADGMGGHAAGDVASRIIAQELSSLGVAVSAADQRARVLERIDRAHHAIREHAGQNGLHTVGATIAALLLHGTSLTCVWAGDSRVYLLREGALTPLTQDHSEVAQMIATGMMTAAEARHSPRRNVITRAIGIGTTPRPETASGVVKDGDRFVICSDGLTEHFDDEELAGWLTGGGPAADTARALIDETLVRGARDNVSVIIVDCRALPEVDEAV